MLAIKNLFIEGPDCSGKTTLVESIHKSTNYRYHIMDRSQISRSIFAKMYNRDIPNIRQDFLDEILDLNNLYIFLIPSWPVIEKRYLERGDDKHSLKSLYRVYSEFKQYADNKQGHPNVLFISDENIDVDNVIDRIKTYELKSLDMISDSVIDSAYASRNNESVNLRFTINPDNSFPGASRDFIYYEKERQYYLNINILSFEKIRNETSWK